MRYPGFYYLVAACALALGACAPKFSGDPTGSVSFSSQTVATIVPNTLAIVSSEGTDFGDGSCNPITVQATNANGTQGSVGSTLTVNLSGAGLGSYYSDSGCSSAITSTTIASGSSSSPTIYFGPVLPASLNTTLTLTATDTSSTLSTDTESVSIHETVVDFSSSGNTSCVALSSGEIQCWGENRNYAVGNGGTPTYVGSPDQVSGLTANGTKVAVGSDHSCAVVDGGVKCWGRNNRGQVGDGSNTDRASPQDAIASSSGVVDVVAGDSHTCALYAAGGVKCWGYNADGQLGNNDLGTNQNSPVDVVDDTGGPGLLANVDAIASLGGDVTCALLSSGGVNCWGKNNHGQVGNNNSGTDAAYPEQVDSDGAGTALSGMGMISAGDNHACAAPSGGGQVYCWGRGTNNEFGDGATSSYSYATATVSVASITMLAAGVQSTCYISSGNLYCAGDNSQGRFGSSNASSTYSSFTQVNGQSGIMNAKVTDVVQGDNTLCMVYNSVVKCMGSDKTGALGVGNTLEYTTPTEVTGYGLGVTKIDGGVEHTCMLVSGGVKCWGSNGRGQIGQGTSTAYYDTPTDVPGLTSGVVDISSGSYHSCAVLSDTTVKCWGKGTAGQLGDGNSANSTSPVLVVDSVSDETMTGATAVAAGGAGTVLDGFTCALVSPEVKCWGGNDFGQIGDGTNGADRAKAVSVLRASDSANLTGVTAIAAGGAHACAMVGDEVRCWGSGAYGQMGDGNATVVNSEAVAVRNTADTADLSTVTSIEAGYATNCAVITSTKIICWGSDQTEETGNSWNPTTTCLGTVPCLLIGDPVVSSGGGDVTGATAVFMAGGTQADASLRGHGCAIISGGLECWGNNKYGQLGLGTYTEQDDSNDVTGMSSGVTVVGGGDRFSCAVVNDVLKCWGTNAARVIGNGLANLYSTATVVADWE